VLKDTQITTLRRAPRTHLEFPLSMPVDTSALSPSLSHPSLGSLRGNDLDDEGVSALAAVLKETKIVSLECAAAPECSLSRQRPLTLLTTSHTPLLAVCERTSSVPREQPLSPRASRATRRCNYWSRPLGARTSSQVFAFLSAPIDTPTLSPSPPHSSLAVSEATASEMRVPPRSQPSSRRRRSPTWSAPPPQSVRFCVNAH
jgi:hypothetical protein